PVERLFVDGFLQDRTVDAFQRQDHGAAALWIAKEGRRQLFQFAPEIGRLGTQERMAHVAPGQRLHEELLKSFAKRRLRPGLSAVVQEGADVFEHSDYST